MAVVFRCHRAFDFHGHVLVHAHQHARHVNVAAAVGVLVSNETGHERDQLSHVVRSPASEVGIDDGCSKNDTAEGRCPPDIKVQLNAGDVHLKTVMERQVVRPVPLDVLLHIMVAHPLILPVLDVVASRCGLTENVGADATKAEPVAMLFPHNLMSAVLF